MISKLIPSNLFLSQIRDLGEAPRKIIEEKINLIKINPYRYKRIDSKKFSKVFRIRLNIKNKDTRLIYMVIEPNIILVCLLERKNDYKDLEKYLTKVNKEFLK